MSLVMARPMIGNREERAVLRALDRCEIARGDDIDRFERRFSRWLGGGQAVSVSTGTAAVEVSIRAAGLAGCEIVTGAISCQSTANALLAAGCKIRFADHDPETWQISPRSAERLMTRRTGALLIVHLFGAPADLTALQTLAKDRGVLIVEDCCQAMGAKWDGRLVGRFGVSSSFSFYANKLITTGEGGMAVFRKAGDATCARRLRNHGQDGPFHHVEFGLNWKMPNILSALGAAQLSRAKGFIRERRRRAEELRRLLSPHSRILLPNTPDRAATAPFCFPLVLKTGSAGVLRARLERRGIETRPIFPPQCDQPYWADSTGKKSEDDIPVARAIARRGLYLSVSPHLTLAEIRFIGRTVLDQL